MANETSTIGVTLKYAVESTAGTCPTTGYTVINNIKGIPEIGATPEALEVTDLSDTYKRYILGLIDTGGIMGLNANNTAAFRTAWAALITTANTALAADKATWFAIVVPSWDDAFYFAGIPVALGIGAQELGSVQSVAANIAVNQVKGYAAKPTT